MIWYEYGSMNGKKKSMNTLFTYLEVEAVTRFQNLEGRNTD